MAKKKEKKAKKKQHNFRLDLDLVQWATEHAEQVGTTKTGLLEALLKALRDERLWVEPRPDTQPNPFPGAVQTEILPVKPYATQGVPAGTYPHRKKDHTHEN